MEADVLRLQALYPQVYLACHVEHVRARSTSFGLSQRDSSLLSHLARDRPTTPRELARHLGVSGSTVSAAVDGLVGLGCVRRVRSERDARQRELYLTDKGAKALAATSVLHEGRVTALLSSLTPQERARAMAGIELLARAARGLAWSSGGHKL